MPRVLKYSPELAQQFCERLIEGATFKQACEDLGIGLTTVWRWQCDFPEFEEAVGLARQASADALAAEAIEIADSDPDPRRAKVRSEVRLKLASAFRPTIYGERMTLDIQSRVNIRAALAEARQRVGLLPVVNPPAALPAPAPADLAEVLE